MLTDTMTAEPWDPIWEIIDEVLSLPSEERPARLDALCGDDATLRSQVEDYLYYCKQAEEQGFLEKSPPVPGPMDFGPVLGGEPAVGLQAGDSVGPYQIVAHLDGGGMGEVFLAERTDPHMRVALKVVKRGMDTDEILRRFRYEREILARLEHPNIARLHDGGVTADERPYFAMEYVEGGQPLDAYCDEHKLSLRARLELFATVCDAVRYAHRNLVVHRDLKPGNILVSRDETGQPQVKLLDFGIAKLLEEDAALHTMQMTEAGARRMTLNYAAPEQITGEATTTATDVYALGVILYKLLTGRRPYHFDDRSVTGIEQVIRHTMPDRPSTIVVRPPRSNGTAEMTPEHLSRQRATSPKMLRRQLKGDLDAIILMALRKEAERRYASAGEFLDDIQRYLNNRPVVAQPDSVGYRASKFVQRHRVGVSITAAVVLLIAMTVGFYTMRLEDERDRANQERDRALSTQNFVIQTFALMDPDGYGDALRALEDTVTVQDILGTGLSQIETLNDPLDRAALLDVMGEVYNTYSHFELAESLYTQALAIKIEELEPTHPDVAVSLHGLAEALSYLGQLERADSLFRRALDIRREALGDTHPDLLDNVNHLAYVQTLKRDRAKAEIWYREALEIARRLEKSPFDTRRVQLRKMESLDGLAGVLRRQGALDEADSLYRQVLDIRRLLLGDHHSKTANTMFTLGRVLMARGDLAGAEDFLNKASKVYRRVYGDHHVVVGTSANELAGLYRERGDYEKAKTAYLEAIDVYEQVGGPTYRWRANPLIDLGRLLVEHDDAASAVSYLQEGLAICKTNGLADDASLVVRGKVWLAASLTKLGQFEEAEAFLLADYRALKDLPNKQGTLRRTLRSLVNLYEAWQKPDEVAIYRALLEQ